MTYKNEICDNFGSDSKILKFNINTENLGED